MEYRRSEYVGDCNVDEVFEGTPKDILELMEGMNKNNKLVYEQKDVVMYIFQKLQDNEIFVSIDVLYEVLDLEEDYMRIVGNG